MLLKLLKIKTRSSGLSRVKSTLHDLPSEPNLELVRAVTLPEQHGRIAKFLPPPNKPQETVQLPGLESPSSIGSILSEAQSHLKAQRKNLLARLLSRGLFKRESRIRTRPINTLRSNSHTLTQPQGESQPQTRVPETTTGSFGAAVNQHTGYQPSATRESSSYVSFDGANSTVRQSVKENWAKKMWDKFSHLLVSSSRAYSSKGGTKRLAETQNPTPIPVFQGGEIQSFTPGIQEITSGWPRVIAVTSGIAELDGVGALKRLTDNPLFDEPHQLNNQQNEWHGNPAHPMSLPPPKSPKSPIVETSATRTASWAASVSSILRKKNYGDPQKVKWTPSSDDDGEVTAEIPSTLLRVDMETVEEGTDFSQAPSRNPSRAVSLSDLSHPREETWKQKKSAEKVELMSTRSEPLTRTRSQQQYLADREAERQTRRDINILRAKAKAKMMKKKADEQAALFKKLDIMHSKKACPFSKWSKRDQLELELLRMQLGIRGAKNSWKMSDLRRLGLADLEELRQSLLPTAKVANRQNNTQHSTRWSE